MFCNQEVVRILNCIQKTSKILGAHDETLMEYNLSPFEGKGISLHSVHVSQNLHSSIGN